MVRERDGVSQGMGAAVCGAVMWAGVLLVPHLHDGCQGRATGEDQVGREAAEKVGHHTAGQAGQLTCSGSSRVGRCRWTMGEARCVALAAQATSPGVPSMAGGAVRKARLQKRQVLWSGCGRLCRWRQCNSVE